MYLVVVGGEHPPTELARSYEQLPRVSLDPGACSRICTGIRTLPGSKPGSSHRCTRVCVPFWCPVFLHFWVNLGGMPVDHASLATHFADSITVCRHGCFATRCSLTSRSRQSDAHPPCRPYEGARQSLWLRHANKSTRGFQASDPDHDPGRTG